MNFIMVTYIIGWILQIESAFLLLPAIVGFFYGEADKSLVYIITALGSFLVGFLIKLKKPKTHDLYTREGFATVAIGWIAMSAVGAVPFRATGEIPHYIDALFETVSGFTTTGGSILNDVEALSHATLFWRSFTHWIGGMGVFVFIMAIFPIMGGYSINLMRAESTGPSVGKLVPRVQNTAKILYAIYMGLTIVGCIVYMICGMSFFEAITTIFGTVGTGGYGILNTSITTYSPAVQWAITIFMILSGINYSVYFCLLRRQFKEAFSISEVKWYIGIILVSTAIIAFNIRELYSGAGESIRQAAFQVGSIITTTGFSTTDFDLWPSLSKTILVILMFCGACSGSTGGGMKISRWLIMGKTIFKELSTIIHPRQVKKIHMDGHVVEHETVRATNVYLASYFFIMLLSVLLISLDNFDFTTNFTGVVAMINNIGPGIGLVGPTGNYSIFSNFSKIVLIFDMLAGRLEIFPMLIILKPACWKKY
ncbi:MAG: TrkH family potassium uptake protein [Lachnospiraceae bacterium]|nr:TrkH family potassium uptake protein [Lachnospiraceae bacterium]